MTSTPKTLGLSHDRAGVRLRKPAAVVTIAFARVDNAHLLMRGAAVARTIRATRMTAGENAESYLLRRRLCS
jgi:hypothetical protein